MADSMPNRKVLCKSCAEDIFIHSRVAVKCVICEDFFLCPECFAGKCDIGCHLPTHPYKFVDNGGFHLFRTDWTANEHLRLLNAIEQYGYGNWEDIAKGINSDPEASYSWRKRTPNDIKDEYCNIFLTGVMGRHTWKETERSKTKDHTQANPLLPPEPPSEPPPNLTFNEAVYLGYFAKRDDFEVEYDNECESLVSQLEDDCLSTTNSALTAEDEELARALNIAHVEVYKTKLRERERRKRVAKDHNLITEFFRDNPIPGGRQANNQNGTSSKKKLPKDPVLERLKILSEFQSAKDHQSFMASVAAEKDLKNKIKDLMRVRKNGITKLSDSIEFEVQRVRRNNRKKNEKRRQQQNAILGEAVAEMNLVLAPSPMSMMNDDFSNSAAPSPAAEASLKSDEKPLISLLPGYEILSVNEKKLCANLSLTPAHYISYKTCLLTNHLQKKKGQTPKPLNPAGLDKNNRKIIFNFLMRAGWITAY